MVVISAEEDLYKGTGGDKTAKAGTVREQPALGATENDFDVWRYYKILASMSTLLHLILVLFGTAEGFLAV